MNPKIPSSAQADWDSGRKIQAIKAVREATGLGLDEARRILESGTLDPGRQDIAPGQPLPADVRAALETGNKIEAIRLLRESTGLGLKEAKERVEAAGTDVRSSQAGVAPGLAPGEIPRGGNRFPGVIVVAVAVALAAWFLLRSG